MKYLRFLIFCVLICWFLFANVERITAQTNDNYNTPSTFNKDERPELIGDAFPNHNTVEGRNKMQEWTQSLIIQTDTKTNNEISNVMEKFKSSIISKNKNLYKSITSKQNTGMNKKFESIIGDFKTFDININEYSFGLSKISPQKDKATVIMMNKHKILTAILILEKQNNEWFIKEIDE